MDDYLKTVADAILAVDQYELGRIAQILRSVRDRGRVFAIGNGGGAGHASHLVCDLRKLCGIEAYAPADNASELTARINDEGWTVSLVDWLRVSRLGKDDVLFVLSVGGGTDDVSSNLLAAVTLAKQRDARVVGVVGTPGGATAYAADAVIIVSAPVGLKTPVVESIQAVVWHALVVHPFLAWEPA